MHLLPDIKQIFTIYFYIIAAYGMSEILLHFVFSGFRVRKTTDRSIILIMVPFYLCIFLAPVENIVFERGLHYGAIITGLILLVAGIIIRIISVVTLGKNFSFVVEAGSENRLVTKGIYRHLRHPAYLASLLLSVAGCVIFSCVFAWIFFLVSIYAIMQRIKIEEEFLLKRFPEYAGYMKRSRKLIPFVY